MGRGDYRGGFRNRDRAGGRRDRLGHEREHRAWDHRCGRRHGGRPRGGGRRRYARDRQTRNAGRVRDRRRRRAKVGGRRDRNGGRSDEDRRHGLRLPGDYGRRRFARLGLGRLRRYGRERLRLGRLLLARRLRGEAGPGEERVQRQPDGDDAAGRTQHHQLLAVHGYQVADRLLDPPRLRGRAARRPGHRRGFLRRRLGRHRRADRRQRHGRLGDARHGHRDTIGRQIGRAVHP